MTFWCINVDVFIPRVMYLFIPIQTWDDFWSHWVILNKYNQTSVIHPVSVSCFCAYGYPHRWIWMFFVAKETSPILHGIILTPYCYRPPLGTRASALGSSLTQTRRFHTICFTWNLTEPTKLMGTIWYSHNANVNIYQRHTLLWYGLIC